MSGKIRRRAAVVADTLRLFFMLSGLAVWLLIQLAKSHRHYYTTIRRSL